MRGSSDWVKAPGGWQRAEMNKTRGLNRNRTEPMYSDYVRMTEQGTKPPMAKLTLARKIAATVLAMWKNQEAYDPEKRRTKG